MTLKITGVSARPIRVPLRRPPVAASGAISDAAMVLIDLQTDGGIIGHAYLFAFIPSMLAPTVSCVEAVADLIRGETVAPLELDAMLRRRFTLMDAHGILGQVLAGLDMAAWDAHARAAGLPLVRMLGGEVRPIRAYNSCGLWIQDPEHLADEAEALLAEGEFNALKIRLGRERLRDDLDAVRNVKERIGSEIFLMSDFNQSLTLQEAIRRGRALDGEGLAWIEEPIRHDDYAGCAKIASALETPVQIGENLLHPLELQKALDAGAADLYMPDVQRIGGVTGWMRAAALTHAQGFEMSSHLFPEVSAHLLGATPNRHWLEYVDWARPILADPAALKEGYLSIPDRPGNGIEWDEKAVAGFMA